MPSSTSRARRISSSAITATRPCRRLGLGAAQHVLGRREILDREPERLEDCQLVVRATALGRADQELADLARMCSGPIAPSRCGKRKSPASLTVDSRRSTKSAASPSSGCRARASSGCSSRPRSRARPASATRARGSARATTSRSRRRRRRARLPRPTRPPRRRRAATPSRRAAPRRRRGRSRAPRASPRGANAPGCPRRGSRASGVLAASRRVATPETAAVRTAVIAPAFRIAFVSPVSPSKSATKPWCESRPRALFPGKIATAFSAYSGALAAAVRGHQPHQARLARRTDDESQRVVHLAARERSERLGHHVDALVHRQEPAHVMLVDHTHGHWKNDAIRSRSAGESATSRAARMGSSCAARFGPQTAPVTPGLASTHANASAAMSIPRASASARELVETVEDRVVDEALVRPGPLRHPRAFGERLAALVLAGQPAAGQRSERHVGDRARLAERQHVAPRRCGRAGNTCSARAPGVRARIASARPAPS